MSLFVVATPIGNLDDISARALQVLKTVDKIAAEDTRHTQKLLNHFGIKQRLLSLHNWNEAKRLDEIIHLLKTGKSVALVSDAGTPLISDPGFVIVRQVQQLNIPVVPIPGPCALISALSVAGLPTNQFVFEGFLPPKGEKRLKRLNYLASETRTVAFYESCHRIELLIQQLKEIFGASRQICIARELTKKFETLIIGDIEQVQQQLVQDENQLKGEFVIIVAGQPEDEQKDLIAAENILKILLAELSVKQAVKLAQKITGVSRQLLYEKALKLKN